MPKTFPFPSLINLRTWSKNPTCNFPIFKKHRIVYLVSWHEIMHVGYVAIDHFLLKKTHRPNLNIIDSFLSRSISFMYFSSTLVCTIRLFYSNLSIKHSRFASQLSSSSPSSSSFFLFSCLRLWRNWCGDYHELRWITRPNTQYSDLSRLIRWNPPS